MAPHAHNRYPLWQTGNHSGRGLRVSGKEGGYLDLNSTP